MSMGNILNSLQAKQIVMPYLENAFHNDQWPDEYYIRVDSEDYYGLTDEEGITHDTGPGDGYFHPSSHPLMTARELYYRYHPDFAALVPRERRSLTSHMTLAAGTAMHAVIQTQLHMAGILMRGETEEDFEWQPVEGDPDVVGRWVEKNPYEWEYINRRHMVRGRMDGRLRHPQGEIGFEFKALDVATPILTGAGWSTMGELIDGDEVYAPDGQLTKVVAAHPVRTGRPCYEVKFRDGQSVVADAEHLWQVRDYAGRCLTLTTQQLHDRGVLVGRKRKSFKYSVPVTDPIQAPDADLPIDPWLLGMWLGDGDSSMVSITSGAQDLDYLTSRLDSLGVSYRVNQYGERTASAVYIHKMRGAFADLGLLDNKHIPEVYMTASEPQRRALLAGLMDSDGGVAGHQVCIGMKRESLMRQVLQLARSLGYRATLTSHESSIDGKKCGLHYVVRMSATHELSPFDMPRKTARFDEYPPGKQDMKRNAIVAVEPVPTRPTRCITVAHESSLYLVGEGFVPTHNTQNSRAYRFQDSSKDEWRYQLNLGMDACGLSRGVVLVMEMGYPFNFKEFPIRRDSDLVQGVYDKFDYVRECVRLNTPPRCEHSFQSAQSKNCPVGHLCWVTTEEES